MIAAIRVRGTVNVRGEIEDTMKMLHLTRANHCSLVREDPSYLGMLRKVKDYITYGPIDAETLSQLITERGRLKGNRPITDDYVKEHTAFNSIKEFAEAIVEGKADYRELPEVKPLFRLHPPIKGHGTIKRHYSVGGSLGNRGEAINELIRRML